MRLGPFVRTEHLWLAGTVNVGVQQPNIRTLDAQRQRQIDRHGGLADPTLARRHRDDVLDTRQRFQALLHFVGDDPALHPKRNFAHARQRRQPIAERSAQRLPIARRRKSQFHLDLDPTVLSADRFNALGSDQILLQIRVHIALQGGFHSSARHGSHHSDS